MLVLEGRASQIEVHLVRTSLLLLSWTKSELEFGVIVRQERDAALCVDGHLPAQEAGPEASEAERVVSIDAERQELASHSTPHPDLLMQRPDRTRPPP
jgi:hypothetical protein